MDGIVRYSLNNNGKSEFRSAQLKWSKVWKKHALMFNAMWQESETSNGNYNETFGLEEMEKIVVLDGKQISLYKLPKDNFNRPIVANLGYTGKFFNHLTVSAALKYRTSYRQIEVEDSNYFLGYGEIDPMTGEETQITTTAYKTVRYQDSFMVDCGFAWEQPIGSHSVTFGLDIDNIFNIKNVVGGSSVSKSYELGRQFWGSVSYSF